MRRTVSSTGTGLSSVTARSASHGGTPSCVSCGLLRLVTGRDAQAATAARSRIWWDECAAEIKADGYLSKPFRLEELFEVVKLHARRS